MKKFLAVCVSILAAAAVCSAQDISPNIAVKDLSGTSALMKDVLKDDVVIVSFWATWCKPCQRELQAIHENYPDWQDETGVKVVAISIDQAQDANKVKPLVDGYGWEYDVLLDPNSDLKRALGINLIPYALVLDGNGNIVYTHTGYVDGGEEELYEEVKKYSK